MMSLKLKSGDVTKICWWNDGESCWRGVLPSKCAQGLIRTNLSAAQHNIQGGRRKKDAHSLLRDIHAQGMVVWVRGEKSRRRRYMRRSRTLRNRVVLDPRPPADSCAELTQLRRHMGHLCRLVSLGMAKITCSSVKFRERITGPDLLHLITVVASPEPLTSQADSKTGVLVTRVRSYLNCHLLLVLRT